MSGGTGRSTRILTDLTRNARVPLCAPKLEHRVLVGASERERERERDRHLYPPADPRPVLTSDAFYRRALKQSPVPLMDGMGAIVFGLKRSRNLIDRSANGLKKCVASLFSPFFSLFFLSFSLFFSTIESH